MRPKTVPDNHAGAFRGRKDSIKNAPLRIVRSGALSVSARIGHR